MVSNFSVPLFIVFLLKTGGFANLIGLNRAVYSSRLSYPSDGSSPAEPSYVSLNITKVFFLMTQFSEQTTKFTFQSAFLTHFEL